jgi:hypothetical protein
MLTHPTLDQLRALKLDGMADAFIELEQQDAARELTHAEWLGLAATKGLVLAVPTFSDAIAAVRHEIAAHQISVMSRPRRDRVEIPQHIWQRMQNALAYAAWIGQTQAKMARTFVLSGVGSADINNAGAHGSSRS